MYEENPAGITAVSTHKLDPTHDGMLGRMRCTVRQVDSVPAAQGMMDMVCSLDRLARKIVLDPEGASTPAQVPYCAQALIVEHIYQHVCAQLLQHDT